MTPDELIKHIDAGGLDGTLGRLYAAGTISARKERLKGLLSRFALIFGGDRDVRVFSAPGRTEIGGNHTDHQRGRILAASVDMDVLCAAAPNDEGIIHIQSKGHALNEVDTRSLAPVEGERSHSTSLVRGVAARSLALGYNVAGFDAYTVSDVPRGSGLSSSAAYEVAVGTMVSGLFNSGGISPMEIAQIGQYAENVYYGKPSGLMDQAASSVGGFVTIDFADSESPIVEPVPFDLSESGYALRIVDTKGSHNDLDHEYASIPEEMRLVARFFGRDFLREVDEAEFYRRLPEIRECCGDRSALRAIHFFDDDRRVPLQAKALREGNFKEFLRLLNESGRSSEARLQNIFSCARPQEQGLSLALAMSEKLLSGRGAWRVHGGGIAGTIQAFVPEDLAVAYSRRMEELFGPGSCHRLSIRPIGGTEIR